MHQGERLPNLKTLNLSGNNLETIRFSGSCVNLEELYCSNNLLVEIDVKELESLRVLDCSFNQIFDLRLPSSVTNLACSDNLMEVIVFEGEDIVLETLYCQNNQIWFIGSEFDDETGTVALAPDAVCDIAGNPSIRVEEGDDGGMRIGLEELDPQDEV